MKQYLVLYDSFSSFAHREEEKFMQMPDKDWEETRHYKGNERDEGKERRQKKV